MNTQVHRLPDAGPPCTVQGNSASLLSEVEALARLADHKLGQMFQKVVRKIEQSFHRQESLMEAICYPGLKDHREEHARVLGVLYHAESRVMGGDCQFARKVVFLLMAWLTVHTNTLDAELTAFETDGIGQHPASAVH